MLIAALAWPLATSARSALDLDAATEHGPDARRRRAVLRVALVLFPAVFVGFAVLLVAARPTYTRLLAEDGVVEWATVGALVAAAVLATVAAAARPAGRAAYVALAAVCVFGALEEISWGQRIFGVANPSFFERYSDQRETNVHNVVQKIMHVTMKWPVGLAFLAYGGIFPLWAAAACRGDTGFTVLDRLRRAGLAPPPLSLVRGFLLASLLMLDLPTNDEEELGELFGALALVFILASARPPAAAD
jgi:hypothetical protein